MKKYELMEETKILSFGTVLHRIRAVRDFMLVYGTNVKAGDLGGWIEKEVNLSHNGSAWVSGEALVYGEASVSGDARVSGKARVYDNAQIYGDASVSGEASVDGEAQIFGDALVESLRDYFVYKNAWSSGRWFTYTRSNRMWKVGCFRGTGDELIAKAYKDSELSGKCYEAIVRVQEEIDKAMEHSSKHGEAAMDFEARGCGLCSTTEKGERQ